MKKYILYIGILVVGILLGYLFFKSPTQTAPSTLSEETEAKGTDQLWTCSMHPQIQKHEPGDCPICGMELIPVDTEHQGLTKDQFRMTPAAMALANIQTTFVGEDTAGENTLRLSGKIQADDDNVYAQAAHYNGRIEKLYVKSLGENIYKGQALAEIYSADLISAQQELLSLYKSRNSQPKLYAAIRKKFNNWMIPDKEIDRILKEQQVSTRLTIYSHITGVLTNLAMQEGGHVMDGMTMIETANLTKVWAVFDVYENEIGAIKKGQQVHIKVNALPAQEFSGTISFIEPILNTQTRTVKARVELNNKNDLLKPGMFIEGKVTTSSSNKKELSIQVPKSAVLWTGKRSVVYVKSNSNEPIFEMREVTLGNETENNYTIIKGLQPGDEIVTHGTFTVDAAAQLQGKKSMMDQEENPVITKNEQADFQQVLDAYFNLKNALVNDNPKTAIAASKLVKKALDNSSLTEKYPSLKVPFQTIKQSNIALQKEDDLKKQRMHFIAISENMAEALENLQGFSQEIYVQKCPMANNNEGARWLSASKEIENPYFGAAMLTCGSVVDVLH